MAKAKTGNKKPAKKSHFLIGIVEGNIQVAFSIAKILEANGFKTFQTFDANDAIKTAKREKPDLLIVDIRLDGITGYDVARALPDYKILFLKGFDGDELKIKSFKNAIGVLDMPLNSEELMRCVGKL